MARKQLGTTPVHGVDAATKAYADPRVTVIDSSPLPTFRIRTSNECLDITDLAEDIVDMSANMTGAPGDFWKLMVRIYGDQGHQVNWGKHFEDGVVALPTATQPRVTHQVGCEYNAAKGKWVCLAAGMVID